MYSGQPQEGVNVMCEGGSVGADGISSVTASLQITMVTSIDQLAFKCSASNGIHGNVIVTATVSIQGI